MPDISVIIPVHGAYPYLEETLRSVISQTYKNYEIIIIDERANDGLEEFVKGISREAIIIKSPGEGAGAARNAGAEAACGKWLAYLDADDLWLPDKLEKQLNATHSIRRPQVVCTSFIEFSGCGVRSRRPRNVKFNINDALRAVLIHDIAIPSAALCSREAVESIGGWMNSQQFEDTKLFAKLAAKFPFEFLDESLTLYRRHEGNRSKAHTSGRFEAYMEVLDVVKGLGINLNKKLIKDFKAHAYYLVSHWHRNAGRRAACIQAAYHAVILAPHAALHWVTLLRALLPARLDEALYTMQNSIVNKYRPLEVRKMDIFK